MASAERGVRAWARDGPIVLSSGGVRFLARRDASGGYVLTEPSGRFAGRFDSLAECRARVRDLVARRGD